MRDTPRHWQPLVRISHDNFKSTPVELIKSSMEFYKIDEAAAREMLMKEHLATEYWGNDLYQIALSDAEDGWQQINIRRRDGGWIRDSRHFQQIKNEIVGEEREAVEIYPGENRWVDTTNKWHLWVLPKGGRVPVGWKKRDVQYEENRNVPGIRQRAL